MNALSARAFAPEAEAPIKAPRARAVQPLRILALGMNYAPEPVGVALYTTGLL